MDDEQIEALADAIKAGTVWWAVDGKIKRCEGVIREWIERFPDGSLATTAEPAVQFIDGTFAALWLSDSSEFVKLSPAF